MNDPGGKTPVGSGTGGTSPKGTASAARRCRRRTRLLPRDAVADSGATLRLQQGDLRSRRCAGALDGRRTHRLRVRARRLRAERQRHLSSITRPPFARTYQRCIAAAFRFEPVPPFDEAVAVWAVHQLSAPVQVVAMLRSARRSSSSARPAEDPPRRASLNLQRLTSCPGRPPSASARPTRSASTIPSSRAARPPPRVGQDQHAAVTAAGTARRRRRPRHSPSPPGATTPSSGSSRTASPWRLSANRLLL